MSNIKDDVTQEDEYFIRQDREKLEKIRQQEQEAAHKAAQDARRAAHFHKCGKCGADMDTQVFKGVEVEVCPECGAVLLDAGELETLAGKDATGAFGVLGDLFRFSKRKRDFEPPDDDRLS